MEGKMFSIYRITGPEGKIYVGYTSMSVLERLRHHVRRANNGEAQGHPLYDGIRRYGKDAYDIDVISQTTIRSRALKIEEMEIAKVPKDLSMNLSSGGVNDAAEGGRIFWERLNESPEKRDEFLKKLSDRKKDSDWTDYEDLSQKALKWRKDNPREAWKKSYRAIRIANKRNGYPPPCQVSEDTRPLKERLMIKYRFDEFSRQNAKRQWMERTPEQKAAIAEKISIKAKARFANMSEEEKRKATAKARAVRYGGNK